MLGILMFEFVRYTAGIFFLFHDQALPAIKLVGPCTSSSKTVGELFGRLLEERLVDWLGRGRSVGEVVEGALLGV